MIDNIFKFLETMLGIADCFWLLLGLAIVALSPIAVIVGLIYWIGRLV